MKNTLHFFSELLEQQDVMKTTPAQVDSSKNTLIMKEEDAKKKEANAARDGSDLQAMIGKVNMTDIQPKERLRKDFANLSGTAGREVQQKHQDFLKLNGLKSDGSDIPDNSLFIVVDQPLAWFNKPREGGGEDPLMNGGVLQEGAKTTFANKMTKNGTTSLGEKFPGQKLLIVPSDCSKILKPAGVA